MSTRKEVLRSPLHHPAFRRLWLGLVISRLGDQFTIMSRVLLVPLVFLRTLPVAMLFMSLAGFAAAPYYVVEQSLMVAQKWLVFTMGMPGNKRTAYRSQRNSLA